MVPKYFVWIYSLSLHFFVRIMFDVDNFVFLTVILNGQIRLSF